MSYGGVPRHEQVQWSGSRVSPLDVPQVDRMARRAIEDAAEDAGYRVEYATLSPTRRSVTI